MKELTRRQREVLQFIDEFVGSKGYPPSVRDIAKRFNLVSAAGVHKHIKALVKKNFLTKTDFLSRSLRVVNPVAAARGEAYREETLELPLVGFVAAGKPIEAIEQSNETLAVPASLAGSGRGHYALQVRGESMIEDGILDGDFVVMEPRQNARNGEMVVALINSQEATLKRFYRENGQIRLQPANPAVAPIIITKDDVSIQGVVVGIWRRYR